MEETTTNTQASMGRPRPSLMLQRRSLAMLRKMRLDDECRIEVMEDGPWTIFDGRVDSQSTKTRLFGLVPQVDGAQWIVDRLRTG